jgi:hypothetical protein
MTAPAGQTDATDMDAQDADNALGDAAAARAQQGSQQGTQSDTADKGTESDNTDWEAEVKKWKALARKHEQTAKELKPLADKAKQLEDAQKTDADKLREQLEATTAELMGYRVSEVRQAAVSQAGLPPECAQFITATDPEAALEQAKNLVKLATTVAGVANGNQQPPPGNFKQGARQTPPAPQDKNQLFHALVAQNR